MVTSKREFTFIDTAREFAIGKTTAGYNTGADRRDTKDGVVWDIYWSVGFLDPDNAVAR